MILGYDEAKKVGGRFYEFSYETSIMRSNKCEHFGCFKDNDKLIFKLNTSVFCWSEKDFEHVVSTWQSQAGGLLDMYAYRSIGKVSQQGYTAEEVVDLIYKRNNFKYLAHLTTIGSIDFIH
jgi:hypothetical protein